MESRFNDKEGLARWDNVRLRGIAEDLEDNSPSMAIFIENLLSEKLEISATSELGIDRVPRCLGPKPPPESPPGSVIVKFASFITKEEVLKLAWLKRGFITRRKR